MALYGTPFVDLSGTVAAGGTSQIFAPADPSRRYLRICNFSTAAGQGLGAAESLWVNDKGAAASASDGRSFEVLPGSVFVWETPPCTAVAVVAASTGHKFEGAQG
jgi:hypothetical protein